MRSLYRADVGSRARAARVRVRFGLLPTRTITLQFVRRHFRFHGSTPATLWFCLPAHTRTPAVRVRAPAAAAHRALHCRAHHAHTVTRTHRAVRARARVSRTPPPRFVRCNAAVPRFLYYAHAVFLPFRARAPRRRAAPARHARTAATTLTALSTTRHAHRALVSAPPHIVLRSLPLRTHAPAIRRRTRTACRALYHIRSATYACSPH